MYGGEAQGTTVGRAVEEHPEDTGVVYRHMMVGRHGEKRTSSGRRSARRYRDREAQEQLGGGPRTYRGWLLRHDGVEAQGTTGWRAKEYLEDTGVGYDGGDARGTAG